MGNSGQPQTGNRATANRTNATESSSGWWRFYLVRYAAGTAVGAVVFYFLCAHSANIAGLLFPAAANTGATMTLDWPHLILLAAYGLAYCYIASSPFLVFHAGRFLLKRCNDVASLKSFARWSFVIILAIALLFTVVCLVLFWCRHKGSEDLWRWPACLPAVWIWLLQWRVVKRTIKEACTTSEGQNVVYRFYKELAKRRGTDEARRGGIVDSYRHLREHGNALSIVVLEIVLGAALMSVASVASDDTKLPLLASVLAVWLAPGALVWLVGAFIELRFSEDSDGPES